MGESLLHMWRQIISRGLSFHASQIRDMRHRHTVEELLAGGPFALREGCDGNWYFLRIGPDTRRPPSFTTYDSSLKRTCTKCHLEFSMGSQAGHFLQPIGGVPYIVVSEVETGADGKSWTAVFNARGCRRIKTPEPLPR